MESIVLFKKVLCFTIALKLFEAYQLLSAKICRCEKQEFYYLLNQNFWPIKNHS